VTLTERSVAAHADTENDYPGDADIVAPPREPANPAPWIVKAENWLRCQRLRGKGSAKIVSGTPPVCDPGTRYLILGFPEK
jgi:hypothetical protein